MEDLRQYLVTGAQHAFNNDTNPERYNAEQARIAWADMLAFFARHLAG